jgi:hypothetical protein
MPSLILSSNFSYTRGTAKKAVGLTNFKVSTIDPERASGRAK